MVDFIYKPIQSSKSDETVQNKTRLPWDHICLYYGTRIVASDLLLTSSSSTLYTVPTGKVFLLITANLTIENEKTGNETGRMFIFNGSNSQRMIVVNVGGGSTTNGSNQAATFAPVVPVRMLAGEAINLTHTETSGSTAFEASIFGYEIDSSIFYSNI